MLREQLRSLWRAIFGRSQVEQEMATELLFHLEARTEDLMAREALTRPDAVRRARIEFGSVERYREEAREHLGVLLFDELQRDVRYAARALRRTPAFTGAAVLTLALAIGVNTALFTLVRQVLLKTLPVVRPHELVQITCASGPRGSSGCMPSYPTFSMLSDQHPGLTGVFAFSPVPSGIVARVDGRRQIITGEMTSGNTFDILGVAPAAGRLLQPTDDRLGAPLVVVLGHEFWTRTFGTADAVGASITLNDQVAMVVGVLPQAYKGITFGAAYDVILPLNAAAVFRSPQLLANPHIGWLTLIGRLEPGLPADQAEERVTGMFRRAAEAAFVDVPTSVRERQLDRDKIRAELRPASTGATSNLRRSIEPTLRIVTIVALLVLMIACTNLAGLLLARALGRQREWALRTALGASRGQLVRQALTEGLLISMTGGAIGFGLAQWIAPVGLSLMTGEDGFLLLDLRPDLWILIATAALTALSGLIAGVGSVVRAGGLHLSRDLRSIRGESSPRLTKSLLAAQIGFTLALVGTAAVFGQSLTNLRRVDIGFRPDQLLTAEMDVGVNHLDRGAFPLYLSNARDQLGAIPGVRAVSYSARPLAGGIGMIVTIEVPGFSGRDLAENSAGVSDIGPDFVRTTGMTLLVGRDVSAADQVESPRVALVNESFAMQFFGTAMAAGRSFSLAPASLNEPMSIVGVVKDVRDRGLKGPPGPMIYRPFALSSARVITFTIRTEGDPAVIAGLVRQRLETLNPNVGVWRMRTVPAQVDEMLRRERLLAVLGETFSGLALLLVAVGVYGLIGGMVARRTNEIGIRLALGATTARIIRMLSRETLTPLLVGTVLGVALQLAFGQLIQSELFGVSPRDPAAVMLAIGVLCAVGAVAVWIPARRAARVDPMIALRCE